TVEHDVGPRVENIVFLEATPDWKRDLGIPLRSVHDDIRNRTLSGSMELVHDSEVGIVELIPGGAFGPTSDGSLNRGLVQVSRHADECNVFRRLDLPHKFQGIVSVYDLDIVS